MLYSLNVQKYIQFLVCTLIALFCTLFFWGCSKEPGEGGKASITGVVYKLKNNGNKEIAADESVYIIYGGKGTHYHDDTKTSYDGSYRFDYLRQGNYTIFAYTDCDNPNDFEDCIERIEVEISKGNRTVRLDSLIID